MRAWLATLEQGLAREERSAIYRVLRDAVPDFKGEAPSPSCTVARSGTSAFGSR